MPDPQTSTNEVSLDKPAAVTFEPTVEYDSSFEKMSPMQFRENLDNVKPKNPGEALSIGLTKYLLNQKKNYQGVKKSDEQISNKMIEQRADVLNDINTQQVLPTDDAAEKELKKQKEEFQKDLKDRYNIPTDQIREGVILPVPQGYRSDYLDKLAMKHPAWAKQYIQLRKDPDTGQLSWQGYNKPSVIEGVSDVELFSTKFKDEGFVEQTDEKTGLKTKVPTPEVQKFWDREANSKDYSPGATRATGLLRNMEAAGNFRVSKLMAKSPELWENFKKYSEELTGQDLNEAGAMQTAMKAISKTFKMDQPISSVTPHYSEWAITDAIQKQNKFAEYTDKFSRQQNDLAAKIRLAGEANMYHEMPQKFDRLHELEVQMRRDPRSMTSQDRKEYNQLKLDLTSATMARMKDSPMANAFRMNATDYEKKYKDHVRDSEILGTEEGKAALNLMAKQYEGYQLGQRIIDYFPGVKRSEQEQKDIDKKGDHFSMFKSFARGLRSSTESMRSGAMRMLGFTEEGIASEIAGEQKSQMDLRTPVREPKTVWNKVANLADEFAEFSGNMAPYIAITAASGGAGAEGAASFLLREGAPFFTSGYNDYYREAKGQGLSDGEAQLKGILGGAALVLSQSVVPKGQMLDRGLINTEVNSLIKEGAINKSRLTDFFSKFITGAAHGEAAVVANGLADYAMNSYLNATKGTTFATDQLEPEKLLKQGLFFGVQSSMMNMLARTDNKDAARALVLKQAESHPLTTLRAIDDALMLSKADKTYDQQALIRMKKEVSEALQMSFPSDLSMEQRIATFDLVKKKQELLTEQSQADKSFYDAYESKIKAIDQQLKDVSEDPKKAEKHLDDISDPLYKKMQAEGYFDKPQEKKVAEPEAVKMEKKGEAPILIRHGETEANRLGLMGSEQDPLNATGRKQAAEVGQDMADRGVKNIVSSPAVRAQETSAEIVKKTGGDVIVNDKLTEWKTGQEGAPVSSFDEKYWVNHPDEAQPGGETFNSFLSRIQGAREELSGLNKETAVVAHGKVLKLLDALEKSNGEWNEKAKAEFLKDKDIPNAVATREGKILDQIEQPEVIRKMKPFTDKMVEIEREFANNGLEINTDYDNEIIVTDKKTGEIVDPEDVPDRLQSMAAQYEKATLKLGEFDASAREKALVESRRIEEAPYEVVKSEELTKQVEKKYGKTVDDIIKKMKEDGVLKIKCPPGSKKKVSLRTVVK